MFRIDFRRVASVWMSGLVVYVVMAASSGASCGGGVSLSENGQSGAGGSGGGASAGGGQDLMDALTDPVPDADADPQSGSRLKRKFFLGDDGAREYEHWIDTAAGTVSSIRNLWYDATRDEDCATQRASDGQLRCLPVDASFSFEAVYADPACTQPLLELKAGPAGCPLHVPRYGRTMEFSGCPSDGFKLRYFAVGALAGPGTQVYRMNGAACTGPTGLDPTVTTYELGPEVAPSEFVGLTPSVEP
jgi:hypothetical protein